MRFRRPVWAWSPFVHVNSSCCSAWNITQDLRVSRNTVRYWWNRFGPLFAAGMRTRRVHHGSYSPWRWHLDEVFVRINGKTCYLWRAVDHEGEVLEVFGVSTSWTDEGD